MAPRLSGQTSIFGVVFFVSKPVLGQTSIFGVVFFVSKPVLGIERLKKLENFAILTRKLRSHVRIVIYRTWPIITRIQFYFIKMLAVTTLVIHF